MSTTRERAHAPGGGLAPQSSRALAVAEIPGRWNERWCRAWCPFMRVRALEERVEVDEGFMVVCRQLPRRRVVLGCVKDGVRLLWETSMMVSSTVTDLASNSMCRRHRAVSTPQRM
jgi:hypothetical protein